MLVMCPCIRAAADSVRRSSVVVAGSRSPSASAKAKTVPALEPGQCARVCCSRTGGAAWLEQFCSQAAVRLNCLASRFRLPACQQVVEVFWKVAFS